MIVNLAVLVLAAVVGFAGSRGSRNLRRPDRAAQASSVARNVGGSLGRRKTLTAPELQRACFSEMVRHVRVSRQGRTLAPARYVLSLHPDDLAVVNETRRWFADGLADALRHAAAENGWDLDGAVEVDFQADPARHQGVPSALAVAPDAPRGSAPVAAPPAPTAPRSAAGSGAGSSRVLVLVRDDTGERIPLDATAVTVGRSRDRTITVDDNRVSRSHARIEARQGQWSITDEGSSNGTRVSGRELAAGRPQALRAGDVITVGPVELRVVTGAPSGSQPGTRALDDSARTRISGEYLPPSRGDA